MRLLSIICMAVLAFYIGKWTNDFWLAVGLFVGVLIGITANWQDEPMLLRHINLDGEEKITIISRPQKDSNKSLFTTVLCILGVTWLFGGDKDDN